MKVGEYVRTNDGYIGKIESIEKNERMHLYQETIYTDNWRNLSSLLEEQVFKSSPNIIDLIEVGDYVNGKKVLNVAIDYIFDYSEEIKIVYFDKDKKDYIYSKVDIKSIVTHEQFSQMEYRIGD